MAPWQMWNKSRSSKSSLKVQSTVVWKLSSSKVWIFFCRYSSGENTNVKASARVCWTNNHDMCIFFYRQIKSYYLNDTQQWDVSMKEKHKGHQTNLTALMVFQHARPVFTPFWSIVRPWTVSNWKIIYVICIGVYYYEILHTLISDTKTWTCFLWYYLW